MDDRGSEKSQGPPEAPRIRLRLRVRPLQLIGFAFIAVLPVLALAGVLGASRGERDVAMAGLRVHVRWPERIRYQQGDEILVSIANDGERPIDTVRVAFSRDYMLHFSDVQLLPSGDEAFRTQLTALEPGSAAIVVAQVQADDYGRHAGAVTIRTTRGDSVVVRISTFTFP